MTIEFMRRDRDSNPKAVTSDLPIFKIGSSSSRILSNILNARFCSELLFDYCLAKQFSELFMVLPLGFEPRPDRLRVCYATINAIEAN